MSLSFFITIDLKDLTIKGEDEMLLLCNFVGTCRKNAHLRIKTNGFAARGGGRKFPLREAYRSQCHASTTQKVISRLGQSRSELGLASLYEPTGRVAEPGFVSHSASVARCRVDPPSH
jgi:hypothetical protein